MTDEFRYLDVARGDRLSPSWWNSRYHALRQLADVMRQVSALPELGGELLVDFGCGDAPYEPLLAPRFTRYVRADLPGNPHAQIEISPDGRLPLPDGVANAVLSSQVLEHVADPRSYLTEAHRVLAPNGVLVVSTHGSWRYHPDPTDYWRWTRDGLELELSSAGFSSIWIRGVLGRTSTAIQLLQDAVSEALPAGVSRLPGLLLQRVIGMMERVRREPAPIDAAIYVIVARPIDR